MSHLERFKSWVRAEYSDFYKETMQNTHAIREGILGITGQSRKENISGPLRDAFADGRLDGFKRIDIFDLHSENELEELKRYFGVFFLWEPKVLSKENEPSPSLKRLIAFYEEYKDELFSSFKPEISEINLDFKLKKLELEKFTTFVNLSIEFSTGINVIIGENSSGKTHLMKLLFSVLKGIQPSEIDLELTRQQEVELLTKLMATFKPDTLGRLANRGGRGRSKAHVVLTATQEGEEVTVCDFSFATNSKKLEVENLIKGSYAVSTLFIPPVEMLTLSEGFIAAYKNRETAYDYTYYALAEALDMQPARGAKEAMAKALVAPILKALDIYVFKQEGKFYVKFKGSRAGSVEASLVAEGLKKMGQLLYLINNGSLSNNSILFWDEPEAHLNPRYIEITVELLKVLASQGVQVFVSTHDYLLSQRLSLMAEKNEEGTPPIKFISLYYDQEAGSSVAETAATLAQIKRNPILDEFARYAAEEESQSWDEF